MTTFYTTDEIRNLIVENVLFILDVKNLNIADDVILTAYGIDSMKSVNLIIELEEIFNIEFEDDDMLFENFSTIQKIISMVSSRLTE